MTYFKSKTPGVHVAETDDVADAHGEPIGIAAEELEGVDEHVLAMVAKASGGRFRFVKKGGKGGSKGKDLKSQTCVNCGKKAIWQ